MSDIRLAIACCRSARRRSRPVLLFLRWTFLDSRVSEDMVLARYIKVRPHVLHAPLPVLVSLANQLKHSSDVTWRPRVVVSTARSLTDANRALLESTFGVGVADFYSTQALGLIAYAKPGMKGYRFITEEFHVEVLPAVAGQRGGPERLVITDLIAGTMPLIRFDTGDLVLREAPRPGALTAPPVISIIGRDVRRGAGAGSAGSRGHSGLRRSAHARRSADVVAAPPVRVPVAKCGTFSSSPTIPDRRGRRLTSAAGARPNRREPPGSGAIRAAY